MTDTTCRTAFSELVKTKRLAMGFNQRELGKRIDASACAISGWENGTRTPHPSRIPELANAIKVEAETLAKLLVFIR